MRIPDFLDRDDYLQNPILRRFLKDHSIRFVDNRADYLNAIQQFSEQSEENFNETSLWLQNVAKEGSKEMCYRKIYGICEWHKDKALVEAKINEFFPECPRKNILTYTNTGNRVMIGYDILTNDDNEVTKIDFIFSQLCLYGETGKLGNVTVFPVFVEVYLNNGFVVSRAKAKSTLYQYDESNPFLVNDYKIDTMTYAVSAIDLIVALFGFEVTTNPQIVKSEIAQMLYKIYEKFTFTPTDVAEKVLSQKDLVNGFVNCLFDNLALDPRNKDKAIMDAQILVEKFISINGNNEDIFKLDRPAYLIKVTADDEIELTKIDTASFKQIPLQCTEAFFDSKKSVIKSRKCKRLNLIFKRQNEKYFSKNNPLVVQLGAQKDYGYIKTLQYAEEGDIQNVLHSVFENY